MDPKFVRQIQNYKREAYKYFESIPNISPDADDITNYIVDKLGQEGNPPDDDTVKKIESIVSGNHLVERLERLTGKKVVLLEMPGSKQNEIIAYLTSHPGATESQITQAIWKRTSAASTGGIRRAMRSGLIRRDETQHPMKYYVIDRPTQAKQPIQQKQPEAKPVESPLPKPIDSSPVKKTYEDYSKMVIDYLKKHPGCAAKELIVMFPTQMSSVPVLQKMLKTGVIVRDMSQRPAKWYVKGTQPSNINTALPIKVARKYKESDKVKIIDIVRHSMYSYLGRSDEGEPVQTSFRDGKFNLYISTRDRGPRTDHGGGEDGDGWMSSDEIRRVARPYEQKYKPILERLVKDLKSGGFKVTQSYVDYGEKGHISLDVSIG